MGLIEIRPLTNYRLIDYRLFVCSVRFCLIIHFGSQPVWLIKSMYFFQTSLKFDIPYPCTHQHTHTDASIGPSIYFYYLSICLGWFGRHLSLVASISLWPVHPSGCLSKTQTSCLFNYFLLFTPFGFARQVIRTSPVCNLIRSAASVCLCPFLSLSQWLCNIFPVVGRP